MHPAAYLISPLRCLMNISELTCPRSGFLFLPPPHQALCQTILVLIHIWLSLSFLVSRRVRPLSFFLVRCRPLWSGGRTWKQHAVAGMRPCSTLHVMYVPSEVLHAQSHLAGPRLKHMAEFIFEK